MLEEMLARCRRDHLAWINGDGSPYSLPDRGSIMGAVGGSSMGGSRTLERQLAVARQWQSGTGTIEMVNGGVSGNVAWLAFIERATVVFAGKSVEDRWDLRVTEIFQREDDEWVRIHRHADPLVDRHQLSELLALLP